MLKLHCEKTNKFNLTLILIILLGITLGCLGPDGSESRCEGVVKFEGETYTGKSKDEKQAGLNACNGFCLENDAEFEGMYEIWLTSEKAKVLEEKKGRKLNKQEAILEDNRLLDHVTINCANRCVREANKGKQTLETSCKD